MSNVYYFHIITCESLVPLSTDTETSITDVSLNQIPCLRSIYHFKSIPPILLFIVSSYFTQSPISLHKVQSIFTWDSKWMCLWVLKCDFPFACPIVPFQCRPFKMIDVPRILGDNMLIMQKIWLRLSYWLLRRRPSVNVAYLMKSIEYCTYCNLLKISITTSVELCCCYIEFNELYMVTIANNCRQQLQASDIFRETQAI